MKRLYTFTLALVVATIVIGGAIAASVGLPTKHVHHFCFVVDPRGGATMHDMDTSPNVHPPKGWRRICVDGLRGKNGKNGTNGTNGATGPMGPAGPVGPQGPAGQNGSSLGNGIIYACVSNGGSLQLDVNGKPCDNAGHMPLKLVVQN